MLTNESEILWIESFLCNKKRVKINGFYSDWADVLNGIPQGTILGPILFIIYINDLPVVCKQFINVYLFAHTVPIYKKGSKVSLTNVVCKVMESVITDHIMKFFLDNDFFSNMQCGFIKGRSTVLQLLNINDEWTSNLECGGQIDCIYIWTLKRPSIRSLIDV